MAEYVAIVYAYLCPLFVDAEGVQRLYEAEPVSKLVIFVEIATMVGAGFILLVIMWTLCILLCLVFSRWEGTLAYVGILCVLVAVIVTVVLLFLPRGTGPDETFVVYDETYIRRTLIVSVLGIMLFIGAIVVCVLHAFDQRRPSAIKPRVY